MRDLAIVTIPALLNFRGEGFLFVGLRQVQSQETHGAWKLLSRSKESRQQLDHKNSETAPQRPTENIQAIRRGKSISAIACETSNAGLE
jgi:hypothetical protein